MRKTDVSDLPNDEMAGQKPANVVRLDSYKEIPEPDLPLQPIGRKVYDDWCRNLLKFGVLTIQAKDAVEMLAIAKQSIAASLAKGKQPTRQAFDMQRAAMIRLEKLDAPETLGKADGHENPYAKFGFAKRERAKRFPR